MQNEWTLRKMLEIKWCGERGAQGEGPATLRLAVKIQMRTTMNTFTLLVRKEEET